MMRKFIDAQRIISSYEQIEAENIPPLSDFNLAASGEKVTSATSKLDAIRRKERMEGNDVTEVLHTQASVPKLDVLSSDEALQISSVFQSLYPEKKLVHVAKFVKSYNKVALGREMICVSNYRAGNANDQFVIAGIIGQNRIEKCPAVVTAILQIDVKFSSEEVPAAEFMVLKLEFFKEHPYRFRYGQRCPMTLWSTEREAPCFVPINFVQRKCCVTKAKAFFEPIRIANNAKSNIRECDIVLFVI